jgi:hypothetical protein
MVNPPTLKYLFIIAFATLLSAQAVSAQQRRSLSSFQKANEGAISRDSCYNLYNKAESLKAIDQDEEAHAYYRLVVESCPSEFFADGSISQLSHTNQNRSKDPYRYVDYREWLKKMLPVADTIPRLYCEIVNAIAVSLAFHETRGVDDWKGYLAVIKFIRENGRCELFESSWINSTKLMWSLTYNRWRDTVSVDTTLYPFDSTLPSLEELGLGLLRGKSGAASERTRSLLNMFVSENPFKGSNEATIQLTKPVLAALTLHDAMGSLVWGSNDLVRMPEGESRYSLETAELASGTYYLRLATSQGEIRTIKLTKVK